MNKKDCVELVRKRAHGSCERCGRSGRSFHHRLKRSQGGLWTPSNIVLVCGHGTAGCHGWIEHNPKLADVEGFHVRPWEQPAQKPICVHVRRWVLLAEDGTYAPVRDHQKDLRLS